jgi:2-polyprenyl-6-methoxyphenol hydroxylase-like FAD-dependent oxidoreductase
MLRARQGHRVLLVDRATFASDTLSTYYIHQAVVAGLERWGLREQVAASNYPQIRQGFFDFGPIVLQGLPPPAGDVAEAYYPRRKVLDAILVDNAVQAGVELRQGFAPENVQRIIASAAASPLVEA